jgi:hypothetical protein
MAGVSSDRLITVADVSTQVSPVTHLPSQAS